MDNCNKIVVGTALFGLNYGQAESKLRIDDRILEDLLDYCFEKGITVFDTAPGYGDAEDRISQYVDSKKRTQYTDLEIITKTPHFDSQATKAQLYKIFKASVERFREKIGKRVKLGLLCHQPDALINSNRGDVYDALSALRQDGIVDKIGISIYDTCQIEGIERNWSLDILQVPLNVFDQRFENSSIVHALRLQGTQIHARSIFLQGLLLQSTEDLNSYFKSGVSFKALTEFQEFVETSNISKLFACLNYVLHVECVDKVIIGVHDKEELKSIINVIGHREFKKPIQFKKFSKNDIDLIDPRRWTR